MEKFIKDLKFLGYLFSCDTIKVVKNKRNQLFGQNFYPESGLVKAYEFNYKKDNKLIPKGYKYFL